MPANSSRSASAARSMWCRVTGSSASVMGASSGIDGGRYRMMTTASMSVNMFGMQTIATIAASCPPLLKGPLGAALKALADPARLRLLSLIQAQPGREACVCHLTEPLGLSQPTVSHHLKVLLGAGLVEREQRGSWAFFRVCEEPLAALRSLLA